MTVMRGMLVAIVILPFPPVLLPDLHSSRVDDPSCTCRNYACLADLCHCERCRRTRFSVPIGIPAPAP